MMERSVHQNDRAILNVCAPKHTDSKHVKQN